jgi:hypothetical protein
MNSLYRPFARLAPAAFILLALPMFAAGQKATVLHAAQAATLLPHQVYFDSQSATTQMRNSGGVRFADGTHMLAVLVNTSGYSSSLQKKYQGYLLTDDALEFGGHRLSPGAYGFGFVKGSFMVLDIGNHELFQVPSPQDEKMSRPMPLQILAENNAGDYRMCGGRDCIGFHRTK